MANVAYFADAGMLPGYLSERHRPHISIGPLETFLQSSNQYDQTHHCHFFSAATSPGQEKLINQKEDPI